MISYHKELVNKLKTILPTHYELALHSGLKTPCISYMLLDNPATLTGDTKEYSTVRYQVKVWGNRLEELYTYAEAIDAAVRTLGFKRRATNELHDRESTMIQIILTFEANALEEL
jgi:hypothetical protein